MEICKRNFERRFILNRTKVLLIQCILTNFVSGIPLFNMEEMWKNIRIHTSNQQLSHWRPHSFILSFSERQLDLECHLTCLQRVTFENSTPDSGTRTRRDGGLFDVFFPCSQCCFGSKLLLTLAGEEVLCSVWVCDSKHLVAHDPEAGPGHSPTVWLLLPGRIHTVHLQAT